MQLFSILRRENIVSFQDQNSHLQKTLKGPSGRTEGPSLLELRIKHSQKTMQISTLYFYGPHDAPAPPPPTPTDRCVGWWVQQELQSRPYTATYILAYSINVNSLPLQEVYIPLISKLSCMTVLQYRNLSRYGYDIDTAPTQQMNGTKYILLLYCISNLI